LECPNQPAVATADRITGRAAAPAARRGPRLGDPPFCHLVGRLLQTSEAFRVAWQNHDIQALTSRERLFFHPDVGDLQMEQHSLTPADHPEMHLVIFTPVLTTDTPTRLRHLLATHTPLVGIDDPSGPGDRE
jgi:hypothetical protein